MHRLRKLLFVPIFIAFLNLSAASQADNHSFYRSVSGAGTIAFLGLGVGLPLIQDGTLATDHSLRALDSLVSAAFLSEGLSRVTHVRRPNGSDFHSFPSTHASTAFAIATVQSQFHPSEAPFWYAGAALIGYSRVQLKEHRYLDVGVGALIGIATARLELSSHRGLLISPFYNGESAGLELSMKF